MTSTELPPKPMPPEGYDCCGGGCADCELRLYVARLKEWQRCVAALRPAEEAADSALAHHALERRGR